MLLVSADKNEVACLNPYTGETYQASKGHRERCNTVAKIADQAKQLREEYRVDEFLAERDALRVEYGVDGYFSELKSFITEYSTNVNALRDEYNSDEYDD